MATLPGPTNDISANVVGVDDSGANNLATGQLDANMTSGAGAVNNQPVAGGLPPLDTPVSSEPIPLNSISPDPVAPPSMPTAGASVAGVNNLLDAVIQKGLLAPDKRQSVEGLVSQGSHLEDALVQSGLAEDQVYQTKAEMFGMEFIDLTMRDIDPGVLQKLPADKAREYMAIPVEDGPMGLKVAMADPLDIQKTKYIGGIVGKNVITVFTTPTMVNYVVDNKYGAQVGTEVAQALEEVGDSSSMIGAVINEVTDLSSVNLASAPVSKIVNMMLEYAIRYKASDIHVEPRENRISVRFRVFGVLTEKLTLPKKLLPSVVSRLKILSNLKIDEHRIPQDGRFQVKMNNNSIDLRVSTVPTVYGEKVVMRLLEKGGGALDISATGMRGHAYKIYVEALKKTQGIILVTGPTGSGKTQTLASSLKLLNTPEVNIMTLENPVEIRVDGVNQVQINEEVGLSFSKGLRAFLRQDPDIIMVGEIRDAETADLAVQAALTGHLVLATLHTNSAAGAIPRLIDMGIEPFLLASTLNVVVGQRLVRRLNDEFKEGYYADKQIVTEIHKILDGIKAYNMYQLPNNDGGDPQTIDDDKLVLYRGNQDPRYRDREYSGRIGIFEAPDVTEKVSKLILQRASASDIQKIAVGDGMVTMVQDGFMKALEGVTTIEEVLRVQQN